MNESGDKKGYIKISWVDKLPEELLKPQMINFICPECGNEIQLEEIYEAVMCPACSIEMYRDGQ